MEEELGWFGMPPHAYQACGARHPYEARPETCWAEMPACAGPRSRKTLVIKAEICWFSIAVGHGASYPTQHLEALQNAS